jgi:hypothetical protein
VRRRIKGVVDGHARSRTPTTVTSYDRLGPAVGEYEVEARNQRDEGIGGILLEPIQSGRSIDIPKRGERPQPLKLCDLRLKQLIKHTHAAGLYHHVGVPCLLQATKHVIRGVHNYPRPNGILNIAVLLPVISIGLVEGDSRALVCNSRRMPR